MDHLNLQFFREPQNLNRRQAHWHTELSEYDFKMHHCPGSLNLVIDRLSRKDVPDGGVKNDNSNITLLQESRFADGNPTETQPSTEKMRQLSFRDSEEILSKIRRRRSQLDEVVKTAMANADDNFKETNGILEYLDKVYVPRDKNLRERIIYAHHDTPIAGHPGKHKTVELV